MRTVQEEESYMIGPEEEAIENRNLGVQESERETGQRLRDCCGANRDEEDSDTMSARDH